MRTKKQMKEMIKFLIRKEVRHSMIAEAAYCRANKRNFQNGDCITDWASAEEEVDEKLAMVFTSFPAIRAFYGLEYIDGQYLEESIR